MTSSTVARQQNQQAIHSAQGAGVVLLFRPPASANFVAIILSSLGRKSIRAGNICQILFCHNRLAGCVRCDSLLDLVILNLPHEAEMIQLLLLRIHLLSQPQHGGPQPKGTYTSRIGFVAEAPRAPCAARA